MAALLVYLWKHFWWTYHPTFILHMSPLLTGLLGLRSWHLWRHFCKHLSDHFCQTYGRTYHFTYRRLLSGLICDLCLHFSRTSLRTYDHTYQILLRGLLPALLPHFCRTYCSTYGTTYRSTSRLHMSALSGPKHLRVKLAPLGLSAVIFICQLINDLSGHLSPDLCRYLSIYLSAHFWRDLWPHFSWTYYGFGHLLFCTCRSN